MSVLWHMGWQICHTWLDGGKAHSTFCIVGSASLQMAGSIRNTALHLLQTAITSVVGLMMSLKVSAPVVIASQAVPGDGSLAVSCSGLGVGASFLC